MNSFIGIDFGSKYIGLSWGCKDLQLAVPLDAIKQYTSLESVWVHLRALVREKSADAFVVGLPLNMDGSEGKRVQEVRQFVAKLQREIDLPVHFVDERLSTEAAQHLIGLKPGSIKQQKQKKRSGVIDSRAATLLLQDFLDSNI